MPKQPTYIVPPPGLKELIEDIIGKKTVRCTIPDCGLSSAYRFSVLLEDDSKVFVKAATDDDTEKWLRNEYLVLSTYKEAFMPAVVNWIDIPATRPVLITQDLTGAYWPASNAGVIWRNNDIDLLLDTVQKLSTIKGHPTLSNLRNDSAAIWTKIAEDPQWFLTLNVCSENWLEHSIDYLIEAEKRVDETGDILVHGDIRSDNCCIYKSQVIFVDWSHSSNGSPDHDLANLLPTLYLEGGPAPYQMMPNAASQASRNCAAHIQRLSKSNLMPLWLTKVFKKLIAIELEWAAQCLHLDKPDGINWRSID